MNRAWLSLIAIVCLCTPAFAQVPEMGRWQDLDFSAEEVHDRTAGQYHGMLADLATQGRLDDDAEVLARVQRVTATLIAAAVALKPEAAGWDWEVHISSDPDLDAYCMAGGKLMLGSDFARRLALDDGELATLIGHEVAHALADHHREALSSALYLSPMPSRSLEVLMSRIDTDLSLRLRLSRLSSIQEHEADQLGMILAPKAGWPASAMVSFYHKLAAVELPSALSDSHPQASARLGMAKALAILFGE